MNLNCNFWKWLSAEIFGFAGFFWGGLDGFLTALIVFMLLDYVSGVVVAYKEQKLSSEVGFWGLIKKCMVLMLVTVGHFLDTQVFGGGSSMFRSAVIGFFLANEGLSILENAGRLKIPLPKKLRKALEQLREDSDEEGETDEDNS